MTAIKEKIEYEKGKTMKLEKQIVKEGGQFNNALIVLDANLEIVKEVLFENNLIDKDEFNLRCFKKKQILLNSVLELIRKLKKESKRIIVPGIVPPKDFKKVRA